MRLVANNNMKLAIGISAFVGFCLLVLPTRTHALSASDFNAGNIIADSIFFDGDTMSESELQQFLNAKVPVCETNHADSGATNDSGPPYTCLKDYKQNVPSRAAEDQLCKEISAASNRSAAQIINIVAGSCGVSEKILLVLLQKEQSLVTDTWPWDIQYRSATGYGCPDTAACSSTYYGFFNQVYSAARVYKYYAKNPDDFNHLPGINNYVLYSPDTDCSGSNVFIQNQATAGLYNYTPYQPNSGAKAHKLSGGRFYASSDPDCGAYGNINFWILYNNWFGSTDGTPFFKVEGDSRTLVLGANNNYYHVPNYDVLGAYGYPDKISKIASKSPSYISGKTFSGDLTKLARFESNDVYLGMFLVDHGERHHFTTREMIEDVYGYDSSQESLLPISLAYYYPQSSNVKEIIKEQEGDRIFLMEAGKRRRIIDLDAFRTGSPAYSTRSYVRLSSDYMESLPASYPVLGNNKLIRTYDDGSYGYWDGDKLFNISRKTVTNLGIAPDYNLDSGEIDNLTRNAEIIVTAVKDESGLYYLLDTGKKFRITAGELAKYGLVDSDFELVSSDLLSRVRSTPMSQFVTINKSGSKHLLKDNQRHHFTSWTAIKEAGFATDDLLSINSRVAAVFPDAGKLVLSTNTLFKIQGQPQTFLINSSASKLYIDSSTMMSQYGFSKNAVMTFSASQVADYPTAGTLDYITKDSTNNVWLVHSGGKRQLISPTQADSGRFDLDISALEKLSANVYNHLSYSGPLKDVLMNEDTNAKYYVESGRKRHIQSQAGITGLGYDASDIDTVSAEFLATLLTGANIN